MTLGDFRKLSEGLDDDVEISITTDDNLFIKACMCSSGLEEIEFDNGKEITFVIAPCQETMVDILIEDAEDKLFDISEN